MQKDSKLVIRTECNLPSHLCLANGARWKAPGQGFCVSGKVESSQCCHSRECDLSSQVGSRGVKAEQTASVKW